MENHFIRFMTDRKCLICGVPSFQRTGAHTKCDSIALKSVICPIWRIFDDRSSLNYFRTLQTVRTFVEYFFSRDIILETGVKIVRKYRLIYSFSSEQSCTKNNLHLCFILSRILEYIRLLSLEEKKNRNKKM